MGVKIGVECRYFGIELLRDRKNIILADCVEKRWISLSDYYSYDSTTTTTSTVATTTTTTTTAVTTTTNTNDNNQEDDLENKEMNDLDLNNNNNNRNNQNQKRLVIRRLQQAMVPGTHLCKVQISKEIYQTKIQQQQQVLEGVQG